MQPKYGSLNQGLGKIAQAFAMQGYNKQRGIDDGMRRHADTDNRISNTFFNQAKTRHENIKADQLEQRPIDRANATRNYISVQSGATYPQLDELQNFRKTGQWTNGVQPDWYTTEFEDALKRLKMLPSAINMATGESNAAQVGSLLEKLATEEYRKKALAGDNRAMGIVGAKPQYSQNAKGVALDQYSGAQQVDPGVADYNRSLGNRNGISFTTPDGSTVQIGGQAVPTATPTKKTTNDLQKDILGAQKAMRDLSSVSDTYQRDYLTYLGRMQAWAGGIADKLGVDGDMPDYAADKQVFVNNVKQFFNQYRKEITGAAASEKELQQLMDSMFNENLGPEVFQRTFNEFSQKIAANLQANQQTMAGGINMNQNFDIPQIQTLEEFNSLPSGAEYIDPDDGKRYRKP